MSNEDITTQDLLDSVRWYIKQNKELTLQIKTLKAELNSNNQQEVVGNYVSYAWYTSRQSGFGGINIFNPKNIENIDDVQAISRWLSEDVVKDKYGEKASCVVLSFQRYQTKQGGANE
jgi:hypothetical protein